MIDLLAYLGTDNAMHAIEILVKEDGHCQAKRICG